MGSLEGAISVKADIYLSRSCSRTSRGEKQGPRSRLARLILLAKIDYIQWVCTVAVFLFFLAVFQMFLPGSVMEKSDNLVKESVDRDLAFLKEIGGLDFGEDLFKFKPLKLLDKFQKQGNEFNSSRKGIRFGHRKPQIALVSILLIIMW